MQWIAPCSAPRGEPAWPFGDCRLSVEALELSGIKGWRRVGGQRRRGLRRLEIVPVVKSVSGTSGCGIEPREDWNPRRQLQHHIAGQVF